MANIDISEFQKLGPEQVDNLHINADTDVRRESIHHTLGSRSTQASPGDHRHDGSDSVKLLEGQVLSGTRAASPVPTDLLPLLVRLGAVDNTTIAPTPPVGDSIPAGFIGAFGGSTAPSGWLLCNGAAVSRTTYDVLFAAIGTAYGSGNGSSTFNLPDLTGRVPVGRDAAQSEFDVLGETGGAKTHTLTTAQLPAHSHGVGTLATGSAGAHTHQGAIRATDGHVRGSVTEARQWGAAGTSPMQLTDSAGAHTHALSGSTANAGSGGAHPNLQPYQVVNYIVKT